MPQIAATPGGGAIARGACSSNSGRHGFGEQDQEGCLQIGFGWVLRVNGSGLDRLAMRSLKVVGPLY